MRFFAGLALIHLSPALMLGPAAAGDLASPSSEKVELKSEATSASSAEGLDALPGLIMRPMNSRVSVAVPFAGTVTELHVLPGQRIKKGAPIATISSRDLLDARSQLAQAEADFQMAQATAQRKRWLVDRNLQSPDVAAEADAQVAKIGATVDRYRREQSLNGLGVKDGLTFVVRSQVDGVVADTLAMVGDAVKSMAAVVAIDTSADVWVSVQVPTSIVSTTRPGDLVMLDGGTTARVVAIGGSLDERTRSTTLYAALEGKSELLPGQMVKVWLKKPIVSGQLATPMDGERGSRPKVSASNGRDQL